MSVEIRVSESERVSVTSAFDFINDYKNHEKFLLAALPLVPVTDHTSGLGATFHGGMGLGPVTLKSTVKVVEWEENRVIAIDSIHGFDVDFRYDFVEVGPEETRVDLFVSYRLPGGIAGKVLGRTIEPFVKVAVKWGTHTMKRLVVEHHNARTA